MKIAFYFCLFLLLHVYAFPQHSTVRVVKAQAGDTVSKVAVRNGADPIEVAKLNGLLPNSVLSTGREIRIPLNAAKNGPSIAAGDDVCFSNSEIDLGVSRFPKEYNGNDVGTALEKLYERENLRKDEFEKTEQFRERVIEAKAAPLIGELHSSSILALRISPFFSYDADAEKMKVWESSLLLSSFKPKSSACDQSSSSGKYELKIDPNSSNRLDSGLNASFSLALAEARQLKPYLGAVLIIRLKPREGGKFFGMTFISGLGYSFPQDSERFSVYYNVLGFWIYDLRDGTILKKIGPDEKARLNGSKDPSASLSPEAENLLTQARTQFKNGNDDEAMATLRRVLASEPMSAESYLILGKIHLRRGDLDQAISSFKTAIFWDNRQIDAHVSLGKIYLEKGDCLQVKNYSASAMEINPENQDALALKRQADRCSK
jgi:tetratricopeptide (TPR) repeat protein